MNETWFEIELRIWTKISAETTVGQNAQSILSLAKTRLQENSGHLENASGHVNLRELEIKINKFYERKKLNQVINILERFLATGSLDYPKIENNITNLERETYEHLAGIIHEALFPFQKLNEISTKKYLN